VPVVPLGPVEPMEGGTETRLTTAGLNPERTVRTIDLIARGGHRVTPQDPLSCTAEADGTPVIARSAGPIGDRSPEIVARVYDREYALVMTKSPELLGALKWLRTLLAQEACYCQAGVRECVVCVTDDLITAIEQGAVP